MNTKTRTEPVIRVYVVELEEGEVTPDGDVVDTVVRHTDHRTTVTMTNGKRLSFRRGDATILILA